MVAFDHAAVNQKKKASMIQLNVSLNRQIIKQFASSIVIEFHAGAAGFKIAAVFFQKISCFKSRTMLKRLFFAKQASK